MEQRRSSQSFKRKELVAKLNATGVRAFKAAADTAKLRGNPYVELVHFVQQLVLSERSDVQMIIADAGLDVSRLTADMTRAIDKLPYGATSVDILAPGVDILSTNPNKAYGTRSGTSMATPQVAAALASVWLVRPEWNYAQGVNWGMSTADRGAALSGPHRAASHSDRSVHHVPCRDSAVLAHSLASAG